MSIEITGQTQTHLPKTRDGETAQVGRSTPTAPQQETGRPSTSDTVSVTDTAAQLHKLEGTLATLPVVDTQRVESIKNMIANGKLEMDAGRVADKLMQFEKHILS